jgi:hypothetical protein
VPPRSAPTTLQLARQADPDCQAVILEKLPGTPVYLGYQSLTASRRVRGAGQLAQERTEPRIEFASLQAASFMELADLFRDSFRDFLIRLCHLFVTSRKGDIVPPRTVFSLVYRYLAGYCHNRT